MYEYYTVFSLFVLFLPQLGRTLAQKKGTEMNTINDPQRHSLVPHRWRTLTD